MSEWQEKEEAPEWFKELPRYLQELLVRLGTAKEEWLYEAPEWQKQLPGYEWFSPESPLMTYRSLAWLSSLAELIPFGGAFGRIAGTLAPVYAINIAERAWRYKYYYPAAIEYYQAQEAYRLKKITESTEKWQPYHEALFYLAKMREEYYEAQKPFSAVSIGYNILKEATYAIPGAWPIRAFGYVFYQPFTQIQAAELGADEVRQALALAAQAEQAGATDVATAIRKKVESIWWLKPKSATEFWLESMGEWGFGQAFVMAGGSALKATLFPPMSWDFMVRTIPGLPSRWGWFTQAFKSALPETLLISAIQVYLEASSSEFATAYSRALVGLPIQEPFTQRIIINPILNRLGIQLPEWTQQLIDQIEDFVSKHATIPPFGPGLLPEFWAHIGYEAGKINFFAPVINFINKIFGLGEGSKETLNAEALVEAAKAVNAQIQAERQLYEAYQEQLKETWGLYWGAKEVFQQLKGYEGPWIAVPRFGLYPSEGYYKTRGYAAWAWRFLGKLGVPETVKAAEIMFTGWLRREVLTGFVEAAKELREWFKEPGVAFPGEGGWFVSIGGEFYKVPEFKGLLGYGEIAAYQRLLSEQAAEGYTGLLGYSELAAASRIQPYTSPQIQRVQEFLGLIGKSWVYGFLPPGAITEFAKEYALTGRIPSPEELLANPELRQYAYSAFRHTFQAWAVNPYTGELTGYGEVFQDAWGLYLSGQISPNQFGDILIKMRMHYYPEALKFELGLETGEINPAFKSIWEKGYFVYRPDINFPGYRFSLNKDELVDFLKYLTDMGITDQKVINELAYKIYKGEWKPPKELPPDIPEPGSGTGSYYKPAYYGGEHQFGGELIVSKPTTLIVGEKGPEVVKVQVNPRVEKQTQEFNVYALNRETLKSLAERLKPFILGD